MFIISDDKNGALKPVNVIFFSQRFWHLCETIETGGKGRGASFLRAIRASNSASPTQGDPPASLAQWGMGQFWAVPQSAALYFVLMLSERLVMMLYLLSIKKRRAKEKEF